MDFLQLENVFNKWLYLSYDPDLLKIIFSCYLANRYDTIPIWLNLIGSPSSGKTILLNSFERAYDFIPLDKLTVAGLASGSKGKNSFINKLPGKVLVIKDLDPLFSSTDDTKKSILGELRSAYDGSFVKVSGAVGDTNVEFKGKFGLIGAGTFALEDQKMQEAFLGERFLTAKIRINDKDRDKILLKSMMSDKKSVMDNEIKEVTKEFINNIDLYNQGFIYRNPDGVIINCAKMLAKCRTPVIRDKYKKEITQPVSSGEVPARILKQLIAISKAAINIGIEKNNIARMIKRICLDSIIESRSRVLKCIGNGINLPKDIKEDVGMSLSAVKRTLEDLNVLKIIDTNSPSYRICDSYLENTIKEIYK